MHYYLDGYNILFRRPLNGSLQEERTALLSAIEAHPTLRRQRITVVFDGPEEGEGGGKRHGLLRVIFTIRPQTADGFILAQLSHHETPRQVTVVTSDRPLASSVRYCGARVESADQFLSRLILPPDPPAPLLTPLWPRAHSSIPTLNSEQENDFQVFQKKLKALDVQEKKIAAPICDESTRWLQLFTERYHHLHSDEE